MAFAFPVRLPYMLVAATACTLLLVSSGDALDPNVGLMQYGIAQWSGTESSPATAITAIAQTDDGYLWLGTHEGLLRFDGIHFERYSKANSGLPDNHISSLLANSDGSLWIGLHSGRVCRRTSTDLTCFGEEAGLPPFEVRGLAQDTSGTLWAASAGGGARKLAQGKFVQAAEQSTHPIHNSIKLAADARGNIWESSFDAGVTVHFPDGRTHRIATPVLPSNLVWGFASDRSGAMWIATFGGLCRFRDAFDTKPEVLGIAEGLPSSNVTTVFMDREDTLWASANNGGLSRLEGRRFRTLTTGDGLADRGLLDIAEDREGNLWLGTMGGLNRLRDRTFALIDHRNGIARDSVRTLIETRAGDVILGTNLDGLLRYRGGRTDALPERLPIDECAPLALHEDAKGALWIGCAGGTIVRWRSGLPVTRYRLNKGSGTFIEVNALNELPNGRVVAATFGLGLVTIEKEFLQAQALAPAALNIAQLFRSADGLWVFSFDRGVFRVGADGAVTSYDGKFGKHRPQNISLDSDGSLWVVLEEGMGHISKDRASVLPLTGTPLEGAHFFNVVEDQSGAYWMSSSSGIFAVPRAYLKALATGTRVTGQPTLYDSADGVSGRNDTGWSQPAAIRTRDGRLWFATSRGVEVANPGRVYRNGIAPRVHMDAVVADDTPLPGSLLASGVVIGAQQRRIELRYTATSLMDPEKTRFSYMLEGEDPGWIDAGTRRSAFYTDLRPGEYHFKVRAANSAGIWSEEGALLTLSKLPTYYQTTLFRVACVATAGLLLFLGYRLKLNQMHKQSVALSEAVAQERQRVEAAKWQEMAHANQVLRRSAMGLTQSTHPDDFIQAFLQEVIQLCEANAGAYFKRLGETEFGFSLLIQGEHVTRGAALDALPCAAEKREISRADWGGYYSRLAAGTVMSWRSKEEREQLPPLARAFHTEQGHTAFWEFPLTVNDRVAGSVGLAFCSGERPSEVIAQTLDALNCQLAIALEVTRLVEEKRAHELATINERAIAEERTRIAREIHDTLAQNFSGILIQLRAMSAADKRGEEESRRFHADRALDLAQEGLAEARRSLESLRPSQLRDGRSLHEALKMMASAFERRSGISIKLAVSPHPPCTPEQENEILRIVQESVTNAVKHSGASEIVLEMQQRDDRVLELCIRDNGHGFDPEAPSEGFGLLGIQERAARIHASFSLESNSSGTSVCLRLKAGEAENYG